MRQIGVSVNEKPEGPFFPDAGVMPRTPCPAHPSLPVQHLLCTDRGLQVTPNGFPDGFSDRT